MNVSINALEVRKLSETSVQTYYKNLRKFYNEFPEDIEITTDNVKTYIDKHYGNKCRNTRRLITITLNTYVLKNRNLEPLHVPSKDKSRATKTNNYNEEEISKLLHGSMNGNVKDEGMFHCISLAVRTGLRIHEILNVKIKDFLVGCEKNPIEILVRRGKGDKSRTVLVAETDKPYFINELKPYVSTLRGENIFPTTYDNWRRRLKRILFDCDILEKKRGFHGMRSYFCTKKYSTMVEKNIPFPYHVLARLMGHSELKSVRNYIRPTIDEVRHYALNT
jgi:integrase